MKSKIILGHPFAGNLYMFFDRQLSNYPHTEPNLHPYYRSLFGYNYNYWHELTFSLFAIFDQIILPPADANIPDYRKYSRNSIYHNKDLGIYFNWEDNFNDEIKEQVQKDLESSFVCNELSQYPSDEKEDILKYVRLYMKLSEKYNCPVLCGGTYQKLFAYLIDNAESQSNNNITDTKPVTFTQNYLNLNIASFNISSLDTLYELKTDKEIKLYANNFLKTINKYGNDINSEAEIKELLQISLSKNSFYNKISSILDTTSFILGCAGLIPHIGFPFSVLSLGGAAISSKFKYNRYSWYQMFSSINKIDKETKIRTL